MSRYLKSISISLSLLLVLLTLPACSQTANTVGMNRHQATRSSFLQADNANSVQSRSRKGGRDQINTAQFSSGKKGVGMTQTNDAALMAKLNLSWYYNWTPFPSPSAPSNIEFVPMLWGGGKLKAHQQALQTQAPVPVLLMVNEPDNTRQANMSADQVANLWPELSQLGVQVSSPTPAQTLGPWLERFMTIANNRGLKVNFIAAHYYGPPKPENFLAKVNETCRKYGLPIWITEFAVADFKSNFNRFSEDDVASFMRAVLPALESNPCVVRYAWFGTRVSTKEGIKTSRLFDENGNLTKLGRIYAEWN